MAAPAAKSPTPVEVVGSFLSAVIGVAGGTGTSTVVTVPGMSVVELAIASAAGATATAPRCDTYSANTFTVTHANNEKFTYIAFGKGIG